MGRRGTRKPQVIFTHLFPDEPVRSGWVTYNDERRGTIVYHQSNPNERMIIHDSKSRNTR